MPEVPYPQKFSWIWASLDFPDSATETTISNLVNGIRVLAVLALFGFVLVQFGFGRFLRDAPREHVTFGGGYGE